MSNQHFSRKPFLIALMHGSELLSEHKEDVNKLNVFPVPDGDTGTNMSLTLESVVDHVKKLQPDASVSDIRRAVTTGALMGARGNSGVITSQILRGLCEGLEDHELLDTQGIAKAFTRAEEVAFAAVRKPVEGTILTVLRDSAKAARYAYKKKYELIDCVTYISKKAHESVENTPNLLPVLKENNVVDAGGYGLAIFIEGVASSLTGKLGSLSEELETKVYQPKVEIEQINDWAGSKYRYCNEFLVDSDKLNSEDTLEFLASIGDCELCVGAAPKFKVHVHSDNPDKVLAYFVKIGQISEVFIHNMQLQSEERTEKLDEEHPHKKTAVVAVAVGEGNVEILKSLGVDVVVSGGQTMNPSTKDLADAAVRANADNIIFLPNNKNIIMSAKSACDVIEANGAVVETRDLPSAFAAMMVYDEDAGLDDNVEEMTDSFEDLTCGEVTFAIKDSKDVDDNPIYEGDCIGIVNGDILSVGKDVEKVVMDLLKKTEADDKDMLTVLAGSDFDESRLNKLVKKIEKKYEDLEIDSHLGGQGLYPIIFSVE
ncbi:MAG: DAK2 domain-containing protein [Coriobacteriia bacterium]|nr:DAK2 domain-containing protein [Coriobacteriia bacterium]